MYKAGNWLIDRQTKQLYVIIQHWGFPESVEVYDPDTKYVFSISCDLGRDRNISQYQYLKELPLSAQLLYTKKV